MASPYAPLPDAEKCTPQGSELRKTFSSHWQVPSVQHIGISDAAVRSGFRAKVYGILTVQMFVTVVICLWFMLTPSVRDACLSLAKQGSYVQLATLIPLLCVMCCLYAAKNDYPVNYYLLLAFTFLMSCNVGYVCAVYQAQGLGGVIVQAFGTTAAIFLGLTFYVLVSKQNFGWMGSLLTMSLMGLIAVQSLGFFFPSLMQNPLYPFVGSVVFSGYIIYDTWKIEQVFGPDDYIVAAIELYLDIINLFLYILQLLSSRD